MVDIPASEGENIMINRPQSQRSVHAAGMVAEITPFSEE